MWFVLHSMLWKRKLFFVLLVCITVSVVFPAHYVFTKTKEILVEENQKRAIDIAICISTFLTQDIERYRTLSKTSILLPDSPSFSYYQQSSLLLRLIKEKTEAAFIFTAKLVDDETKAYVLDGEDHQSKLFSPFGSHDNLKPIEKEAYQTRSFIASLIEEDPNWGKFLTGYAPIIDARDDTIVGWVGVDYNAEFLYKRYARVSWILGICFTFLILSLSTILYGLILSIQKKSNIDYMTKLGNKRSFSKISLALLKDAQLSNKPFALLMIDVNKFKQINDTYGHPIGDVVLKRIAMVLVSILGSSHGCFRYGGDEFAILIPSCSLPKAAILKEDIHQEVHSLSIEQLQNYRISVSIGMAVWEEGKTLQALIDEADQNLYEQKKLFHSNTK